MRSEQEKIIYNALRESFSLTHIYERESIRNFSQIKKRAIEKDSILFLDAPYLYIDRVERTEFSVFVPKLNIDLRIECKSQKTKGTVDNNLVSVVDLVDFFPEKQIAFVYNVEGAARDNRIKFAIAKANKISLSTGKHVKVFLSNDDFIEYLKTLI